jgi:hypothetical protein
MATIPKPAILIIDGGDGVPDVLLPNRGLLTMTLLGLNAATSIPVIIVIIVGFSLSIIAAGRVSAVASSHGVIVRNLTLRRVVAWNALLDVRVDSGGLLGPYLGHNSSVLVLETRNRQVRILASWENPRSLWFRELILAKVREAGGTGGAES